MSQKILHSFERLKEYVEGESFKGYDPFDGLNSVFFQSIPFLKTSKWARLIWIQFFKRNPINLRPFLGVPKEYNPKALGLFLTGYCNLYRLKPEQSTLDTIVRLANLLLQLKSPGYSGAAWGYNFDWQARAFFQPKYTPTVVATSFIVDALLNAYEITKEERYLNTAVDARNFILKDLNRTYDNKGNFCFSYSPLDHTQVFNAGLLGAKTLSLIYPYIKEEILLSEAKKVVQYVVDHQQPNGAWAYGTLPFHHWIDSFHTGYNLEAIHTYQEISRDFAYSNHLKKGLEYYLNTFFTPEGLPKYYNDRLYPIDIHAPAQLTVTLKKMGQLKKHKELVDKVLHWTIDNMQSPKGNFYYQKRKFYTNKIPYIRWSDAWMFYAMSHYMTG